MILQVVVWGRGNRADRRDKEHGAPKPRETGWGWWGGGEPGQAGLAACAGVDPWAEAGASSANVTVGQGWRRLVAGADSDGVSELQAGPGDMSKCRAGLEADVQETVRRDYQLPDWTNSGVRVG